MENYIFMHYHGIDKKYWNCFVGKPNSDHTYGMYLLCYNARSQNLIFLSSKALKEIVPKPVFTRVVKRSSIDFISILKKIRLFCFVESLTRKPRFTNIMQQYLHLSPEHALLVSPEDFRRDIFKCLDNLITELYDEKANESKDIIIWDNLDFADFRIDLQTAYKFKYTDKFALTKDVQYSYFRKY